MFAEWRHRYIVPISCIVNGDSNLYGEITLLMTCFGLVGLLTSVMEMIVISFPIFLKCCL